MEPAVADTVFHALASPHRRRVLERLSRGPASVSQLASEFDMQLPSFVQHLTILEKSRLVRSSKAGRIRTYEMDLEQMGVVETWLSDRRRDWETRFDRFDAYVLQLKKESES